MRGLYLVTDRACCGGRDLELIVAQAVQGGVRCVQLREKDLATRPFVELARRLKTLLAPRGVPLIINDRIDIALACGAQGVHLGQSDLPVTEARKLLPPDVFVGWSVETMQEVTRSAALPVDYLGVSPVFATPTKTDTAMPWGLDGLKHVRDVSPLPLVAIGGIHLHNAAGVMQAGADSLAVVSAICSADDPRVAAQQLRKLIDAH